MKGGLEWVRSSYGVPARRGGRVEYTGKGKSQMGTITGASGSHILIRLDEVGFPQPFHPTWSLRYLDAAPAAAAEPEDTPVRGISGAVIVDELESASPLKDGEE